MQKETLNPVFVVVGDAMGENVRNRNDDIESNGRRFQETPPNVAATMRSLIKAQEE